MTNRDIEAARAYHESTKLSYINLDNKPPLYKSYTSLPVVPLPTNFSPPDAPTLEALAGLGPLVHQTLDLVSLAGLLFFSAGLVRKGASKAGEVRFRAAASAGALYPVEAYVICGGISGLGPGVYHFSPAEFILTQLRSGEYRNALSNAAGGDASVALSPVTLVLTAIFWRSAWKYRARAYRYCLWDTGTIVANLLASAFASGIRGRLITGFVDGEVNRLLGVQPEQEGSICLVPLGGADSSETQGVRHERVEANTVVADPLEFEDQVEYPEILQVHATSSLKSVGEVEAWRGAPALEQPAGEVSTESLDPQPDFGESRGLADVIQQRGSTRRFAPRSISLRQLSAILDSSAVGVPADILGPGGSSFLDMYLIVNSVQGSTSGGYFFSRSKRELELLRRGEFRAEAGHLCFEQALGADAGAVVFILADLERIFERHGSRSYRVAHLEAGVLGGKLYLAAHSLGLGATGLTFYDDAVAKFFSPHAAGKSTIFVVALGVTSGMNRVRPFRSRVGVVMDALARGAVKEGD